jgi:acyltransferase-like protein
MDSQLDTLTRINLDDLISSIGWQDHSVPAAFVRWLFVRPARKFAGQMLEYDTLVGKLGLHKASCDILHRYYIKGLRVQGQENIPSSGPVLFLSNHPGMADTVSLFAAIPRSDLRIIAIHRPFLVSLPNVSAHLSYIGDEPSERMRAVRQVASHLRAGGAALTFPAGKIEPDPEVHTGALESLKDWTDSSGIFLRFVPSLKIVPVLVSGVIWERTARHWLTRLKRDQEDQEKLAASMQLLAMVVRDARPTTVDIRFGKPITQNESDPLDLSCVHQKLMERMCCLLEQKSTEKGASRL